MNTTVITAIGVVDTDHAQIEQRLFLDAAEVGYVEPPAIDADPYEPEFGGECLHAHLSYEGPDYSVGLFGESWTCEDCGADLTDSLTATQYDQEA